MACPTCAASHGDVSRDFCLNPACGRAFVCRACGQRVPLTSTSCCGVAVAMCAHDWRLVGRGARARASMPALVERVTESFSARQRSWIIAREQTFRAETWREVSVAHAPAHVQADWSVIHCVNCKVNVVFSSSAGGAAGKVGVPSVESCVALLQDAAANVAALPRLT